MANARCMRAAQVQPRGLLFTPVPSRCAASGAVEAVGSGAVASALRAPGGRCLRMADYVMVTTATDR